MSRFLRNIFLPVTVSCCCNLVHAQQNSVQLPSLITGQETKKTGATNEFSVENVLKRSMFVKVFASKNKIFVGEPVMAIYKFYTAVSGQAMVTQQPEFSGWSVRELNYEDEPQVETINGEAYKTYIIRKVQLTPLQPGTLSLGVASVNNLIELPSSDDPFVTDKYNISVSNSLASIEVAPLPRKNRPSGFYGITGIFKIAASALSDKLPVGESGHLIVTIKGSGNLDAINKPDIIWPGSTEHFEGDDSQHINQDNFPISGDRTFDIPFVGKQEGTVIIPPITFSYFNIALKNYQTVTTDSIAISFTRALAKKEEYTDVVNYDITNRKYLWIVPAIAVTVALVGFVSYRRNRIQAEKNLAAAPTITPPPVFANPAPEIYIKYRTDFSRYWNDIQGLTDNKLFFSRAKELLLKAIAERVDSREHSEELLLAELKQRTYNAAVCKKVSNLYEACNLNIYAPFEMQTDLQLYFNELKNVIEELQAES